MSWQLIPAKVQSLITAFCQENRVTVEDIMRVHKANRFRRHEVWQVLYDAGSTVTEISTYWGCCHSTVSVVVVRASKWSMNHARCRSCKTTKRKHIARGLCTTCYDRRRNGGAPRNREGRPASDRVWDVKVEEKNPAFGIPLVGFIESGGRPLQSFGEVVVPVKLAKSGEVVNLLASSLRIVDRVDDIDAIFAEVGA